MVRPAKRTYILIADGGRARLLLYPGADFTVEQIEGADYRNHVPPDRELARDRPSRIYESTTPRRSAEERVDLHRVAEERFAVTLAEMLDQRNTANEFDRLVVVAPPQMLASLRQSISKAVRQRITCEIAKDLTKVPNEELWTLIEDDLRL